MRPRIKGKPKIVPRSVKTTMRAQRQSPPKVSVVENVSTTIAATSALKVTATNRLDISTEKHASDCGDDRHTIQQVLQTCNVTPNNSTAGETAASRSSSTVLSMTSCLKFMPETVPGTLTTSVTTQRQLTSEVSSSGEVEATVAATGALKPPLAYKIDASELRNAPYFDVSGMKDATNLGVTDEVAPNASPTRLVPFCIGTADEMCARASSSVNDTQDWANTMIGEPAPKVDVAYPDITLSAAQVSDVRSEGALSGVERCRQKLLQPRPTTIDAEVRGHLKMPIAHYIYFNPVGKRMSHKTGIPSAEEGIVSTERDSTAIANVAVGSAGSSEPKTAEMGATASFNEEDTLGSQRSPMQLHPRSATCTVVHDMGIPEANYSSFQHRHHANRWWTAQETARFYRALKVFGTDFDLMRTAFPNRTHKNLKNKFKREERENQQLVQKIINDPTKFNLKGFEDEFSWPNGLKPKQKRMKHGKEI